MFQLIHSITTGELFKRQLPVFGASFLIAELFYKWHSFALECVGFLLTWYVLDAIAQRFFGTISVGARADDDRID